jgi:hypothetical protein
LIDETNGEIVNAERAPIEGVKIYDANGDDKVDDQDIVDVKNDIMGSPTSTGTFDKSAADVNNDGVVNALDIVLMIKILNSH